MAEAAASLFNTHNIHVPLSCQLHQYGVIILTSKSPLNHGHKLIPKHCSVVIQKNYTHIWRLSGLQVYAGYIQPDSN